MTSSFETTGQTLSTMPEIPPAEYDDAARKRNMAEALGRNIDGWPKARRILGTTALGAALSATIVTAQYSADVLATKEYLKEAKPVIEVVSQPNSPTDGHRMIMGIGGFGTTDARNAMEALPYETIGLETSLAYDQRGIDTTAIKDSLKEFALEHDIDEIVLSGHSMGGIITLEIASLLYEDDDAPSVSDIILDCTPPNLSAVHDDKIDAGDKMNELTKPIPGHRSSTYLKAIGEMASRNSRYLDDDEGGQLIPSLDVLAFGREAQAVKREKMLPEDGTVGLALDQYREIVADGAEDSFRRMSPIKYSKRSPRIHFLRPLDAASDTTVLIERAQELFIEYGLKYHIPVRIHTLDAGTWHASPGQTPQQYHALVSKDILPSIRKTYEDRRAFIEAGETMPPSPKKPESDERTAASEPVF